MSKLLTGGVFQKQTYLKSWKCSLILVSTSICLNQVYPNVCLSKEIHEFMPSREVKEKPVFFVVVLFYLLTSACWNVVTDTGPGALVLRFCTAVWGTDYPRLKIDGPRDKTDSSLRKCSSSLVRGSSECRQCKGFQLIEPSAQKRERKNHRSRMNELVSFRKVSEAKPAQLMWPSVILL